MAKFAQYHLEFILDNLFAQSYKTERQKYFGALLENKESIKFTMGNGNEQITYKHEVAHLKLNKDIIIMRIANEKKKEVVQDFKKKQVKHEPPCFVIIDNRQGCRRIAIQKCPDSFHNTGQVSRILTEVLGKQMIRDYNIGIMLHPQFYPQDFFKAWRMHQRNTHRLQFKLGDGKRPADFDNKNMDSDSITGFAIAVTEESVTRKYRTSIVIEPPKNETILPVDESSPMIRNLVRVHAQTGAPIEIITTDGATFTCFISDEGDSARIVTSEIDTKLVEALFENTGISRSKAEEGILNFVNNMKYTVDEDERNMDEDEKYMDEDERKEMPS